MEATKLGEAAQLRLSLADVARLAGVRRPVVSMWRTRSAASGDPFPAPVGTDGQVELFDADAVVAWLEQTGRGNNPTVRDDVAAFARPADASLERSQVPTGPLTALLCLKAVTGSTLGGLDAEELVDLADEVDPDDDYLFREVQRLGESGPALARHVDRLTDASYSPARAFEQVLADRFRRHIPGLAATALRDDARHLVARVTQALAGAADVQPPVFVDPTLSAGDLLVEVAGVDDDGPAPTVLTSDADAEVCRLARRRMRVHDLVREPLHVEDDGSFEVGRPAVHVAQLPPAGAPSMGEAEILSSIDTIALQMDERQLAVVVAPASVLTERLASRESERIRDGLLRSDRIRAILRLPKGLLPRASRQHLALWALGPAHPDVGVADRWTVIGDLADVPLDESVVEDVVTDVVAAFGGRPLVWSHSFRFGRPVSTRSLLARRGSLVGHVAGWSHHRGRTGADLVVGIEQLSRSLGMIDAFGAPVVPVAAAEPGDSEARVHLTLGEAVERGLLRLLAGNRIDAVELGASIGVVAVGPNELNETLPWGGRRSDRLAFAARYPGGRLTEPGDVVFCTSPRVAARVDDEGGSVVLSPARVLRPAGGDRLGRAVRRVVPAVLAADINAVPAGSRQWGSWPVRVVPPEQAGLLADALSRLERERRAARDRLAQLDQLSELLMDGVSGGRVTLAVPSSVPSSSTTREKGH